jgi:hypothetical protein
MKEMTKEEIKAQEDRDYTQELWEEVTGMQFLLGDDCDFLTDEQKSKIQMISNHEGADWQKVMYIARKLMREAVREWAEDVKEKFWHYKGAGLNRNKGYLGVRIRRNKWTYSIEWFRFKKSGQETFSETIKLNSKAGKVSTSQVSNWAKPREIEALEEAEAEFLQIRKVQERIGDIGDALLSIEGKMRSRDKRVREEG